MPIIQIDDVSQKQFDFIVVGGGTAGLALATRLSEDPKVSVLVIEAGQSHLHDPKVDKPSNFGSTLGDPKYTWDFTSVKQRHANNRELEWPRGKGLGGTSNVNLFVWCKPPAADMDAIERLGNPGWNWADFAKYSKRSEMFFPPAAAMVDAYPGLTFDPEYRGTDGAIPVSYPAQSYTMDKIVRESILRIPDVRVVDDPTGGDITGTWMCSSNIDPRKWERITSASGYLLPNMQRQNLNILTNCLVSRILFADSTTPGEDLTAIGVEYISEGQLHVAHGTSIILSAGTIKSPHILELSGIGNASILSNLGIDVKVNLPGVGENLQEHTYQSVAFELRPDAPPDVFSLFTNPEHEKAAKEAYATGAGFRLGITSQTFIPLHVANPEDCSTILQRAEDEVAGLKMAGSLLPGIGEQFDIQLENLHDSTLPDHQILMMPGKWPMSEEAPNQRVISIMAAQNHPFSRGSIHIGSTDPKEHPLIDPNHLGIEIDRELNVQDIKLARKIAATEPLKSAILREITPGPGCVSDEDIREFNKSAVQTMWHCVGTCSMLPREKNGVVDPQLKVYGTTNLHVADISVIPLHFAAHSQTVAYAIGEKAADILKGR